MINLAISSYDGAFISPRPSLLTFNQAGLSTGKRQFEQLGADLVVAGQFGMAAQQIIRNAAPKFYVIQLKLTRMKYLDTSKICTNVEDSE